VFRILIILTLINSFLTFKARADDDIITIEKKIKLHHFKHTKLILFKIDSCAFYFDAAHFMSEAGLNKGVHDYHAPMHKDLTLLLGQKDTVDISNHRERSIILSMVNEGLKKGYVEIYFSGKPIHEKTITNIEYWDKGVRSSHLKDSNLYRPESDIFTNHDGEIFYYFKPSLKRSKEQRNRDY